RRWPKEFPPPRVSRGRTIGSPRCTGGCAWGRIALSGIACRAAVGQRCGRGPRFGGGSVFHDNPSPTQTRQRGLVYLIKPIVEPNRVIVAHEPGFLNTQDGGDILPRPQRAMGIIGAAGRFREATVVIGQELAVYKRVGLCSRRHTRQAEQLHPAILVRPVVPFHAPFGLWTSSQDQFNLQLRRGSTELSCSLNLLPFGRGLEDAVVVGVKRDGTAVLGQPSAHEVEVGLHRLA